MVSNDYIHQLFCCRECLSKLIGVNVKRENVRSAQFTGTCSRCGRQKHIIGAVDLQTRLKAHKYK